MIIVWGTTHAGKVDQVPGGMFHVVTRFGHVYYIPLIPTGSFLVLEKSTDGTFHGIPIPISAKSLFTGWLRAFCVLAAIGAGIGLMITFPDRPNVGLAWIAPLAIVCLAVTSLVMTYRLKFFTEASYERAKELAQHIGLSEVGALMLEVAYGRLTAAQAETELARLEQQKAANSDERPVEAVVLDS